MTKIRRSPVISYLRTGERKGALAQGGGRQKSDLLVLNTDCNLHIKVCDFNQDGTLACLHNAFT